MTGWNCGPAPRSRPAEVMTHPTHDRRDWFEELPTPRRRPDLTAAALCRRCGSGGTVDYGARVDCVHCGPTRQTGTPPAAAPEPWLNDWLAARPTPDAGGRDRFTPEPERTALQRSDRRPLSLLQHRECARSEASA
jgi:hypothetical protein